jgi:AbrB family looped-hinge helix DNA binding protein
MQKIKAVVDERGRIVIPAKVRRKMRIEPMTRIDIRIERVAPKKSFVEVAEGLLEGRGDAVKLLHEKSPFR